MARRPAQPASMAMAMLEQITLPGSASLDDRAMQLSQLRTANFDPPAAIDRFLLETILMLRDNLANTRDGLCGAQQEQERLRELIDRLTTPHWHSAIYLGATSTAGIEGALVQSGEERRVVHWGPGVMPELFEPGDEVYLTGERNVLIARADGSSFPTGELADFRRATSDGRLVLSSRDEEIVVLAKQALRGELKRGDLVRFSRTAGLAFEKVEPSHGETFFLESTPSESFDQIGGLDPEIETIKSALSLSFFHAKTAARYKLRPKRSILFSGPPGNGKTLMAKAAANYLASLSPTGRSLFGSIKPCALKSMWYGESERQFRSMFKTAREAATPGLPVCLFFDEIDSIASTRGEAVHRIDDNVLTAFMAELSGLEDRGNIVILSASNRIDSIDAAMLRPGRIGDLIIHFPRPKAKAARAILSRHLPADLPYSTNGRSPEAARQELLDRAVAQIYAQSSETELAAIQLRDGRQRLVRARDLVSGAHLESIAQGAIERACVRDTEGGPQGLCDADLSAAIADFFLAAPRALSPRSARNFLSDLPDDVDVVKVELIQRKVAQPQRYRMETA